MSDHPIQSSSLQLRHKRSSRVEVTVVSNLGSAANYPSSSSSSSLSSTSISSFTATNYPPPPPPPFPVYSTYPSTNFYTISGSPLLPPPPTPLPPNWNYIEDTRVNTRPQHRHQKNKWSPVAESFTPSHHPYQKHPVPPPPQQKERRHRKLPHELLSESQKKANHIASEQKRRQNIRIGFDQLIDIVPSLNHGNRSEALILQKSVDHIRHLILLKNQLKNQVRDLQGTLGEANYEEDSSEDELLYIR